MERDTQSDQRLTRDTARHQINKDQHQQSDALDALHLRPNLHQALPTDQKATDLSKRATAVDFGASSITGSLSDIGPLTARNRDNAAMIPALTGFKPSLSANRDGR
jgi:hypothetical protein